MPDETPPDDEKVVRPFADWLREQGQGRTHDELSEGLADLVSAIQATGKGGSIVLTINLKPLEKGNTNAIIVTDKVTVKAPQLERKSSVFFPDEAGNLHRSDPNQLAFDSLRDVSAPEQPREADHAERAAGDLR